MGEIHLKVNGYNGGRSLRSAGTLEAELDLYQTNSFYTILIAFYTNSFLSFLHRNIIEIREFPITEKIQQKCIFSKGKVLRKKNCM